MNKDDIIRMAREAHLDVYGLGNDREKFVSVVEHFANLVAAAEREKVAQWMIQRSYATGHGDTTEDLLAELEWQIAENWNRAMINGVETEREACAKVCENYPDPIYVWTDVKTKFADAIRARGQK